MNSQDPRIVEINIYFDRRLAMAATLLLAVFVCLTYLAWGEGIALAAKDQAPSAVNGLVRLRQYYITADTHNGANTLSACADGYHMASLWEIYDTSNLSYNTSLGKTSGDSGFGPPTEGPAWVRTGWYDTQSDQDSSGIANCVAWTSEADDMYGSVARVQPDWENDHGPYLYPNWQTWTNTCDTSTRVWCVED
jgi:hypothetical protein